MPPRKPLGVVSGVLRSPCASIQTSATSGWRSRTAASTGGTSVHSLITTTGVPAATAVRLAASISREVGGERVLGRALPEAHGPLRDVDQAGDVPSACAVVLMCSSQRCSLAASSASPSSVSSAGMPRLENCAISGSSMPGG